MSNILKPIADRIIRLHASFPEDPDMWVENVLYAQLREAYDTTHDPTTFVPYLEKPEDVAKEPWCQYEAIPEVFCVVAGIELREAIRGLPAANKQQRRAKHAWLEAYDEDWKAIGALVRAAEAMLMLQPADETPTTIKIRKDMKKAIDGFEGHF